MVATRFWRAAQAGGVAVPAAREPVQLHDTMLVGWAVVARESPAMSLSPAGCATTRPRTVLR
jgi:hypothetical protein